MYRSPFELVMRDFGVKAAEGMDELVFKAAYSVGGKVDKAELISALRHDRGQYDKGFADGEEAALNNRWIPVWDRLPEEGQEIITCTLHRWGDRTVGVKIFWSERQYGWGDVTHWMPLPEPPKEVE